MLQTRTRALHPRLTFANQMPAELHSNGTTCHAGSTVRGSIMTGKHFWGCKCCGVYDRHNEVVQPIRPTSSMSASSLAQPALWMVTSLASKGKARQDTRMGRSGGSPFAQQRVACLRREHSGSNCSQPLRYRCIQPVVSQPECSGQIRREDENGQVKTLMPTAWYRLRTDYPHNVWRHGGAAPEALLESTLVQSGNRR